MSNPPVFHFAVGERECGTAALGRNRGTTKNTGTGLIQVLILELE